MMIRRAIRSLFPSVALLWSVAFAQGADPLARTALQSKGTLYVGQQILVDVDVLVPNYFLQPPQFPPIDLSGAIVTLQDGPALNLNETIDGTAYSGIRRTYVVTPQQAGDFALPPAEITFGYAAVPGQTTQGKVSLPPLTFAVQAAPGAAAAGSSGVVAAKVEVTQVFDRDPTTLKAGDTLVRTITVRAEGMRAMMIPEPDLSAPEGVRLYRKDPALSDETDRTGQPVAGVRRDEASYLFADAGTFVLPAVTVIWFDPATAKSQSATASTTTVTVAAAPSPPSTAIAPPGERQAAPFDWFRAAGMAALAILAGLVIALLALALSRLQAWCGRRQSQYRQSEAAHFRRVEDACRDGDAAEIARELDAWSRTAGIAPLQSWLERYADAATQEAYCRHQRTLYGSAGTDDKSLPRMFPSGLRAARKLWLDKEGHQGATPVGSALPPLNPAMAGADIG
ncbi:BatD family protein [Rhizobium sp. TRM96647]|uniref:BatD family protein n=1 Tax=unclassified Rhizobium TaxID=2613769 RepID=UPI0021E94056|nr:MULTISPECIES: BatD family protein [unclassified Rhizobium]MCV3736222.1 BatD family protein [Rhizobium sp. TRM96647]MCV3758116.1 BatD family protein [Rhizobium sp. TRM96650]